MTRTFPLRHGAILLLKGRVCSGGAAPPDQTLAKELGNILLMMTVSTAARRREFCGDKLLLFTWVNFLCQNGLDPKKHP